jgi:transposase-like protein
VGRPSKFTEEVAKRICDAVRAGSYLSVAARHAGVSATTVYGWLRLAAEEGADPGLVAFAAELDKAEADGEVHTLGVIRREITRGNTRAGFEFLARRHPERWSPRRSLSTSEPSGVEHEEPQERPLDLTRLSDSDYEALKEIRRRAAER